MALSNKLTDYLDIKEKLDEALRSPRGLVLTLRSRGAAVYWRQRACHFRALGRQTAEAYCYDDLEFSVNGPTVVITKAIGPVLAVQHL